MLQQGASALDCCGYSLVQKIAEFAAVKNKKRLGIARKRDTAPDFLFLNVYRT
jgi:hypothetical protein